MMVSKHDGLKTLKVRNNSRIKKFASSEKEFAKIAAPFTPDVIVYCKSKYIWLANKSKEELLKKAQKEIDAYVKKNGYTPKVMVIEGIGLVAVGDNVAGCDVILVV